MIIAIITNADGRLEVFALGNMGLGNELLHKHQNMPGDSNWSGWDRVGTIKGWSPRRRPAVALNPDGTLEAFMIANDNTLYHTWQTKQSFPAFQDWVSFGTTQWPLTSNPALGRNLDGRLNLFLTAFNGVTYHQWQISNVDSWNNWTNNWKELLPK